MPRKDTFHEAVHAALIKEGWTITHDPYLRNEPERTLYLAMPTEAYDAVLVGIEGEALIKKENLKLLVFDINLQVVEQWIE